MITSCSGSEGSDEPEIRGFALVCEPRIERHGIGDVREGVLSALFAGLEGNSPPFFGLAITGLHDGVAGDERLDGCDTEFDSFLHDEVHVFPLGDGLGQCDGRGGRGGVFGRAESQRHMIARDRNNFRAGASAASVEHGDGGTGFDTQDLGEVTRFITAQRGLHDPVLGR